MPSIILCDHTERTNESVRAIETKNLRKENENHSVIYHDVHFVARPVCKKESEGFFQSNLRIDKFQTRILLSVVEHLVSHPTTISRYVRWTMNDQHE